MKGEIREKALERKRQEDICFLLKEEDMEDFLEFIYERENARSTIQKYRTDIETFSRFIGEDKEVRKSRLVDYKEWLKERYATSSANSMMAALNQFLEFMGAGQLKLHRFKCQEAPFSREEKALDKTEYQRLIQTAVRQGKVQLALILETMGSTGIRVSELRCITMESIMIGKAEIDNKGKRRIILIPDMLRKKLLSYGKRQGISRGSIFLTRGGKPKDRSNIWKEMKSLAEGADIAPEKIFPHNLRHFFAATFYQLTKNLVHLADLLGHSSLEVTRSYARSRFSDCMKDVDCLYEKIRKDLTEQHNHNYVVTIKP